MLRLWLRVAELRLTEKFRFADLLLSWTVPSSGSKKWSISAKTGRFLLERYSSVATSFYRTINLYSRLHGWLPARFFRLTGDQGPRPNTQRRLSESYPVAATPVADKAQIASSGFRVSRDQAVCLTE